MPLEALPFWIDRAAELIDHYTLGRINKSALREHREAIGKCACELAEYLYQNEGSENKVSESVRGQAVTYEPGTAYRICQRHLRMTGLMYRGASHAS